MCRSPYREGASASVAKELEALPDLPLNVLKARWHELYGMLPPARLGRGLIAKAVAYKIQERALGGLKPAVRRHLIQAAEEVATGRTPSAPPIVIKPGTRLLREWQGVTHEVIVLEDGVQYRGKMWASLSAVAREITGTRWSGPLFFGLKGRRDDRR